MRLLIHIGTDKAGSTAIQQHLFANRAWLAGKGVLVPATGLGEDNGHARLFESSSSQLVIDLVDELAAAKKSKYKIAVLSWEGLHYFSVRKIRRWFSLLPRTDISVLVYLRDQAEIVQSGYLQQIKECLSHRSPLELEQLHGLLQRLFAYRALYHPSRNYFNMLRRWEKAIPGANICARVYEPARLHGQDVVDDFLQQLTVDVDDEFFRIQSLANVSLDVESALLINRWWQQDTPVEGMRRLIDIVLSIIAARGGGEKYFLSKESVHSVRAHYSKSNANMARRYFSDFKNPFQTEPPCYRRLDNSAMAVRVEQMRKQVECIDEIPSHFGPLREGTELGSGAKFVSGWQRLEASLIWSRGLESRLSFRLCFQNILPVHEWLRLFIKGRYYGIENGTQVNINGVNFGAQQLSHNHQGLLLSLNQLRPNERIDVVLTHSTPLSPCQFEGADDDREIAFAVESIGYDLLTSISLEE